MGIFSAKSKRVEEDFLSNGAMPGDAEKGRTVWQGGRPALDITINSTSLKTYLSTQKIRNGEEGTITHFL